MAFSNEIKRRIISDNLRTQEKELTAVLEARVSHISDLAAVLLQPYEGRRMTVENLMAIGEDALLTASEVGIHRDVRTEMRDSLGVAMTAVAAYDRAMLSSRIASHLHRAGTPLHMDDFLPHVDIPPRVAYVRNAYTDEAFDAFAFSLEDATATFADTYEDACADVVEGIAGYCILPWRDTIGAYHRATLSMLEVHGLVAVSTVVVTDGEDVPMQYALVARAASPVRGAWELLLSLPQEWTARLCELTATIPHFGMDLSGLSTASDGQSVLCTLRGDTGMILLFIWLCLFAPNYHIRGLYPNTEEIKE